MTKDLKVLLHNYGLLYITLNILETQHTKSKKISLSEYDKSLGEIEPDEPAIVVKISKEGINQLIDPTEEHYNIKETKISKNVKILEVPEDEFYFFRAFREGSFTLNQEIPEFIYNMWITHSYGLFENYLMGIIKKRTNSQSQFQKLSKKSIRDIFIEIRKEYGFGKLSTDFDQKIYRISLIRNCLVHNQAKVSRKLSEEFSEFKPDDEITQTYQDVIDIIFILRNAAYKIDKGYESIN